MSNCDFGEISGISGVWANEHTLAQCHYVLQEVREEWLVRSRWGRPFLTASRTDPYVQSYRIQFYVGFLPI